MGPGDRAAATGPLTAATVRNRIRVLRAEKQWSQEELAGRIAMKGPNAIKAAIARAFGLPVDQVFEDESEIGHGAGRARR